MPNCYAKGCRNTSVNGVKMNFFPKDPQRRATWIKICKKYGATTWKLPNDHSALCEYHFAADQWEKPRGDGKKKLKRTAVPTIFNDLVVQIVKKTKNIPPKVGYFSTNAIIVRTNPNKEGIQILTQPDLKSKFLLINGQTNIINNPRIISIKGNPNAIKSLQVPSKVEPNKSLLLNSNGVSCMVVKGEPSEVPNKSIKAEVNTDVSESTTVNVQNDYELEEDSETDSFIAENFEPISYEEIDPNEQINENFEAVANKIGSIKPNELPGKGKIVKNTIAVEENHLHSLQAELAKTTCDKTDSKCNNCEKIEKMYIKSERLRTMMNKNCEKQQRNLKRRIQMLEAQVKLLEGNQTSLHKILSQDQIGFLCKNRKKQYIWSETTLEKANLYKNTFGRNGYQLLLDHHWPLPSLGTLRNKQDEKIKTNFDDCDDKDDKDILCLS